MKIKLNATARRKGSATLWMLGLVALVIGAVVVYSLWRFCKKGVPATAPGPVTQKTNDEHTTVPPWFASMNQWWVDSNQGPGNPDIASQPQAYCVLDYGITNAGGT